MKLCESQFDWKKKLIDRDGCKRPTEEEKTLMAIGPDKKNKGIGLSVNIGKK